MPAPAFDPNSTPHVGPVVRSISADGRIVELHGIRTTQTEWRGPEVVRPPVRGDLPKGVVRVNFTPGAGTTGDVSGAGAGQTVQSLRSNVQMGAGVWIATYLILERLWRAIRRPPPAPGDVVEPKRQEDDLIMGHIILSAAEGLALALELARKKKLRDRNNRRKSATIRGYGKR